MLAPSGHGAVLTVTEQSGPTRNARRQTAPRGPPTVPHACGPSHTLGSGSSQAMLRGAGKEHGHDAVQAYPLLLPVIENPPIYMSDCSHGHKSLLHISRFKFKFNQVRRLLSPEEHQQQHWSVAQLEAPAGWQQHKAAVECNRLFEKDAVIFRIVAPTPAEARGRGGKGNRSNSSSVAAVAAAA